MDNKYLRNVIEALLNVVPSSYLASFEFSFDLLNNRLYNELWLRNYNSTDGWIQPNPYILNNPDARNNKAEDTLVNVCQELMRQGKDTLYNFIVFTIKGYCRNSSERKVELRGIKNALRSIGISDFYEIEKYAKDTPLIESIINIDSWPDISNAIYKINKSCSIAESEIDFQNIGNSCRDLIISLAQFVYNPLVHGDKNDEGIIISKTDAKGMLTNYFNYTLSGSSNDKYRKYAKATNDLANMLTHKRDATKKDMQLTVTSTIALVNFVMILQDE